jgi:putative transposase
MAITLDLKKDQLIDLPNGLFRFVQEKPHNVLLLEKEDTGLEIRLPEYKLVDMLGRGKAKLVDFFKDGEPGPETNADFGPGEAWTEEDDANAKATEEGRHALVLQFLTKKWDESSDHPLGDEGLRKLIVKWRSVLVQMGLHPAGMMELDPANKKQGLPVQPARLRTCIRDCGRIGERPLRAFRSRRGKTPRKPFDNIVEKKIEEAVQFYWEERAHTYSDAYAKLRTDMEEINRGQDIPFKFPRRPEVLRRRIRKAMNFVTWSRKYSPDEAHKKFRGVKNGLRATWPLELGIMDDTKIDTWTVLDTEKFLPLGRANLTVNFDVATRCVLGYLLSFEPPSLYSALTTLKRSNKNKNYIRTLYPEISGSWDAWGRQEEILLDNAWQYKAPSFQHSLANLGISVVWAPVRTGQYKTFGERFFRTLNTMLFHRLKGGVPYNPVVMRQVGLDPKADAFITLGDLDALIHHAIIVYHNEKHEGLGGIPARIWDEKIAIRKRHFISDITALDHILGRVETVQLTTKGIRFKNMDFHDPAVTSGLLDDLLRGAAVRSQNEKTYAPGRVKVVIKWNPADAGSISVWNRDGQPRPHFVTMPNRDPKFFNGISFWHWDQIREHAEKKDIEWQSEAGRWKARDDLRKHWERVAGKLPMRDSIDARRGLAFSQGQFDQTNVNRPVDIDPDTVIESEATPSTDGLNQPEGVPDEVVASLIDGENLPRKGRTPIKRSIAKAKRTRNNNKEEVAQAKYEAEVRERKGDPAGNPVTDTSPKTTVSPSPSAASTVSGWDDEDLKDVDGADAPLASDQDGNADGWDDDFQ